MTLSAMWTSWYRKYILNYFDGDYLTIGRNNTTGQDPFVPFEPNYQASDLDNASPYLYNGNIRNMTTAIKDMDVTGYTYTYDQLNRIAGMQSWANLDVPTWSWQTGGQTPDMYKTSYTYDANGNIETLQRYDQDGTLMDDFTYSYHANAANRDNNKLLHVQDLVSSSVQTGDYEDNTSYNPSDPTFEYDEIGNLVSDDYEQLTISWNVYGKVKQVIDAKDNLTMNFGYDATGNRITKQVIDHSNNDSSSYTFYIRDVTGNVMATYQYHDALQLKELMIYGSSRLGTYSPDDLTKTSTTFICTSGNTLGLRYDFDLGRKQFELSNHLGNVLATVSDRKLPVEDVSNLGFVDYYEADLISAQDYFPFGMVMESRQTVGDYMFGFNGMEKDDEVKGVGNSLDFGARIYDSRLGRFKSIDPKWKSFPSASHFNFAGNNPVMLIDKNGENPEKPADESFSVITVSNDDRNQYVTTETRTLTTIEENDKERTRILHLKKVSNKIHSMTGEIDNGVVVETTHKISEIYNSETGNWEVANSEIIEICQRQQEFGEFEALDSWTNTISNFNQKRVDGKPFNVYMKNKISNHILAAQMAGSLPFILSGVGFSLAGSNADINKIIMTIGFLGIPTSFYDAGDMVINLEVDKYSVMILSMSSSETIHRTPQSKDEKYRGPTSFQDLLSRDK